MIHAFTTRRKAHEHSFWRNNGLSLTVLALFLVTLIGQTLTGFSQYNEEQLEHGQSVVALSGYMLAGHFLEVTAENWESEFLQMGFYIWLTSFLLQKGSSESRKIGAINPVDRDPRQVKITSNMPWPVRRGGWMLGIYE